jgi:hypothetical protein
LTVVRLGTAGYFPDLRAKLMRTILLACSISLLLASWTPADAAGGREPRDPSKVPTSTGDDISKRGDEQLKQCMDDWEPATHMTKQEWRRTCQRVVRERVKFLQEQANDRAK